MSSTRRESCTIRRTHAHLLPASPRWRGRAGDGRGGCRLPGAGLRGGGIIFILAPRAARRGWWDRHFMPVFAIERSTMVAAEQAMRGLIALAGVGLSLVFRRPIAAVLNPATIGGELRIFLAVVLALGASELILRGHPPHPHDADPPVQEPRRPSHPLLVANFLA